jgi:acylphosphatase
LLPVTKRVRIEGRVQGVWYRGWTIEQARARGLSGWVRNRRDGSVEAIFHGPGPVVGEMLAVCRSGPPAASVASITEQTVSTPVADGFKQRKTK